MSLVKIKPDRKPGTLHRDAITAVDKVPTITITAVDQAGVAGSLTAVAHGIAVAPGNRYGTSGTSAIVQVTPTVNKSIDITVPQAAGAEWYDIFLSTSTTGPLWVARVTEAQRVAGCAVTAVATVGAGGAAGKVNVQVVGTGLANTNAIFAQNNAYTPASVTAINCANNIKAYVHVKAVVTDLRSAPTLNIVPFFKNQVSAEFHQGQAQAVSLLTALGQSLEQLFEVDVDGVTGLVVLVGTISGQGTAVTIHVELV